jgi:hypothetical protein
MTPDQFRASLATLGLSPRGFADALHVEDRTVRRWLDGTRSIPEWVPVIIDLLAYQSRSLNTNGSG